MIGRLAVLVLLFTISGQIGCERSPQSPIPSVTSAAANNTEKAEQAIAITRLRPDPSSRKRITNQFGMTFCRVKVDIGKWNHLPTYPTTTYFLQETELSWEQHSAFRNSAFGDGTYETIDWNFNSGFPSEWRAVHRYAYALSKFDKEYNYRLPTFQEWTFACKDGYDQNCPKEPTRMNNDALVNKFGILGLCNNNVECGNIPGLFMGYHDPPGPNTPPPDCKCDWWAKGNPDADDGLNELITARFVLVLDE